MNSLRRLLKFDDVAFQEKCGEVTGASGLLHVVGDDDDGTGWLQLEKQLFNLGGSHRVERGTRLVEQQDFRVDRQGASDAEPLLLAAGQGIGGLMELIFDFLPESGAAETVFDGIEKFSLCNR